MRSRRAEEGGLLGVLRPTTSDGCVARTAKRHWDLSLLAIQLIRSRAALFWLCSGFAYLKCLLLVVLRKFV
jgi:hypothetical protein